MTWYVYWNIVIMSTNYSFITGPIGKNTDGIMSVFVKVKLEFTILLYFVF